MSSVDIYAFTSYRKLIEARLGSEIDRGSRGRLAKAARCNPSWITRALNGTANLTPDQALGIAHYFNFNDSEIDYFLHLVEYDRAATPLLRFRIQKKLNELKTAGKEIAASAKTDIEVSEAQSVRYFSSWIYAAIHATCMIEAFTAVELSARWKLKRSGVEKALMTLSEMGLVLNKLGKWKASAKSMHLGPTHAMANLAHVHWRSRTIQALSAQESEGFHYSGIHHLSRSDMDVIQRTLKNAILRSREIIDQSPSEEIGILCVDWYTP